MGQLPEGAVAELRAFYPSCSPRCEAPGRRIQPSNIGSLTIVCGFEER